ncbi:hypothetical protein PYCCODRAFT_320318 [Trametes coccinea BRFM310]|uniref:Uncharacterized protein n=1 Tax=Trametes coccinea (strain BRFM310) TaxID=1353009 RepID=A0A1Y2IRI4_TRAC3|nr:hypothetical protein PYCCODRAFT_320318 [Trametes coccinea BRFM310]
MVPVSAGLSSSSTSFNRLRKHRTIETMKAVAAGYLLRVDLSPRSEVLTMELSLTQKSVTSELSSGAHLEDIHIATQPTHGDLRNRGTTRFPLLNWYESKL